MESRCPAYNITARKHHVCAQDDPSLQPRELLVHAKFRNLTIPRGKFATGFSASKVKFSLSWLLNEIRHQEDMRDTHNLFTSASLPSALDGGEWPGSRYNRLTSGKRIAVPIW
jgi:hypothetical protein